jgi:hypothetical protein
MMQGLPKDLKPIARLARQQGWEVPAKKAGSGHYIWISPAGARVVTSSTSCSRRGFQNAVATLKKAGLRGL